MSLCGVGCERCTLPSQGSIHPEWKRCLQGISRTVSCSSNSSKHTGHLSPLSEKNNKTAALFSLSNIKVYKISMFFSCISMYHIQTGLPWSSCWQKTGFKHILTQHIKFLVHLSTFSKPACELDSSLCHHHFHFHYHHICEMSVKNGCNVNTQFILSPACSGEMTTTVRVWTAVLAAGGGRRWSQSDRSNAPESSKSRPCIRDLFIQTSRQHSASLNSSVMHLM